MSDLNVVLPPGFIDRLAGLLGDERINFQSIYELPASAGLRVNSLKLDAVDGFRNQLSRSMFFENIEPIPWCPTGFLLPGNLTPGKHPYHSAGLYYLQDPSAMAVAEILAPFPGERVLDLSAAPGGKATHLAALMRNQGLLIANEIHPRRVWELAENLERCGVTNAIVLNETPARLAAHFGAFFDRVLVDAPCSGEGMFRKSATARQDWTPELVRSCAARQAAILEDAVRLVRPGGRLAYSTCTFNPLENEGVIARLLLEHPEFELVEIERRDGFSAGRADWVPGGQPELARCVRLWPHLAPGEGHFIALLQKSNGFLRVFSGSARKNTQKVDPESRRLFAAFYQATLKVAIDEDRLALSGSYLYQLPLESPDLGNLKIIHPGWWLGSFKKDRFEPAHALALGLRLTDAKQVLNIKAGSPEISAYLHGETLTNPGEAGWVLIGVDGYPLGWGKRAQGVIKNYYPKGLRWNEVDKKIGR